MKYKYNYFTGELNQQMMILENIKRQKRIVNNSKRYSESEKALIMKGLDMAFDRVWSVHDEERLL